MEFPQRHVVRAQVIQHLRGLSGVMLQEIVGACEVFKSVGFFSQTVIHHSPVMGDDRRRLPVRFLLVRLRGRELLQRCLERMRDTTLDGSYRLLRDNDRDHVPLCQLLVEFAGTIEIALRYPVALESPLPERTPAPGEGQGRLVKAWESTGQECLNRSEGLSEAPLVFQSTYSIQSARHGIVTFWAPGKKRKLPTQFIGVLGANLRHRACFRTPL